MYDLCRDVACYVPTIYNHGGTRIKHGIILFITMIKRLLRNQQLLNPI